MITMTMNPTTIRPVTALVASGVAALAAVAAFAGSRVLRRKAQPEPKPFGVDARHIPHDHEGPVDAFVEGEFIKTYSHIKTACSDRELAAVAVERHAPVELHIPVAE